jgi:hypothetical protein
MNKTMQIVLAVAGFFVVGFIMVGASKEEQTVAEKEASSMIRNYVAMQTMASNKCPEAIKTATGEQVYFPKETKSDKDTYITLIWVGEDSKKGFQKASCTLHAALGGISELVIDDKTIIKKQLK